MRYFLFIGFGMLLSSSIWAQKSCASVRTGVFQAKPNAKTNDVYVTVERTTSEQREILPEGDTVHYSVRWLSDCKFVLENTESDERVRMVVTITKIRANYYEYTSTMLVHPLVTGRMYRKKGNL
jgi:hypothetical protein